jgi:hypothetical protein
VIGSSVSSLCLFPNPRHAIKIQDQIFQQLPTNNKEKRDSAMGFDSIHFSE